MVYSDRFLIRSMQLVGATRGFIMRPFLLKGFYQGFWAAIIACLMLGGMLYFGYAKVEGLSETIDKSLFYYLFPSVIICGILFTMLSTLFSVRRILRLKSELIYLCKIMAVKKDNKSTVEFAFRTENYILMIAGIPVIIFGII